MYIHVNIYVYMFFSSVYTYMYIYIHNQHIRNVGPFGYGFSYHHKNDDPGQIWDAGHVGLQAGAMAMDAKLVQEYWFPRETMVCSL